MSVAVHAGDCLAVMPTLAASAFDSCVTDPPYHLASIVKRFGAANAAPAKDRDGLYQRSSRGFMGKQWDGGDVAFRVETWAAVFRLLKPGAHLVAFAATRNYHRMACAIEDAGFEIRDMLQWLYGSGFPKSHNQHGDWEGWGTALKPACEPIVFARKPLIGTVAANLAEHGVGALNIDRCRVEGAKPDTTRGAGGQNGAFSPIAAQGRILDDGRGRWPANVLHDGSDEVLAAFPEAPGAQATVTGREPSTSTRNVLGLYNERAAATPRGDTGSAARFFYSAKADADDRIGSKHPTVKPVDLMQWLCRLVTPPGALVLDPFAGSGTTGAACIREGFSAVLIEREAEYVADIHARLEAMSTEGRHSGSVKARNAKPTDPMPLFGGDAA